MKTTFKVEGLRELGEAMKALGNDVALRISRAMVNAGAQLVKKSAIANIEKSPSVDTGSLKSSVIVKRLGKNQTRLTAESIVTVRGKGKKKKDGTRDTAAPHAHFVEFGTVNMPAEPFLRPALDTNKTKAVDAMKAKGKDRIEAAARKAAKGRK